MPDSVDFRHATLTDRGCQTRSAIDRQTQWARERTVMASERTFAAWIRTGLAALAFGIAIHSLNGDVPGWMSRIEESGLILFAGLCFVAGLRRIDRFSYSGPSGPSLIYRLLPAMSLLLLGASVAALVDIWL